MDGNAVNGIKMSLLKTAVSIKDDNLGDCIALNYMCIQYSSGGIGGDSHGSS